MDLDVKTPETAMPENDNSKPAEAGVTINTTVDKKEDVISTSATTSEPKEAPIKNAEPAPNNSSAVVEPTETNNQAPQQAEAMAPPRVDASKPVPAGNILDTTKDGTETAKQVAADAQDEKQKREEELAKLAQTSQPNPSMPTTDGIRGQSMAGMVQEMNANDSQNVPTGQPAPSTEAEAGQSPNTNSQVQQPKKKSWWKFW